MKVKDRLIGALFKDIIEQQVKERMPAASMLNYRKEDEGWRKLTADASRNLDPMTQERMIDIAFYLWEANPLANWMIEIVVDFILAEGLPYEADNEDVRNVLDEFWFDPINALDMNLRKHVREKRIFGELCLPVFTAQHTGKVRLGYIDPKNIDKVITDPENVKMIIGVELKGTAGKPGRQYKTVLRRGAEDILSPEARAMRNGYRDGECFFFSINNVTNSPRGRSDLLVTADWLDAYEQFLFDYADKWPLLNTFVWDLKVEGANSDEIQKHVQSFTKKSGSVYGHNEKVALNASTPDLKSVDAEVGARLLRNHILGSKGFPSFWYGGGEDANRAVGVEMGTPAYKMLAAKQREEKYMLEAIFECVIDRAREAKYLRVSDEDADNYSIITPEIVSKDLTKYSTVIRDITTALITAETQGWLDRATAQDIFINLVGYLGIEINKDEMEQAIQKEEENKGYEDYENRKDSRGQGFK